MDTVTFNNQIWGNKNLETTKFQNGDDIFLAQNVEEWKNASFLNIGNQSMWWSSTNKSDIQAQVFSISGLNNNIMQSDARKQSYFGCYIRCVIE